jgi:hypothetical protein
VAEIEHVQRYTWSIYEDMSADGWEDLFAKAADIPDPKRQQQNGTNNNDTNDDDERPLGVKGSSNNNNSSSSSSNNKRRKRTHGGKGNNNNSNNNDAKFKELDPDAETMLKTRIYSVDQLDNMMWPYWTKYLTTGLDGSSSCSGWKQQDNNNNVATASATATTAASSSSSKPTSRSYNLRCANCGKLDIQHRMEFATCSTTLSSSSSEWAMETSWPIHLLSYIRNIRCTGKVIAKLAGEKVDIAFHLTRIKEDWQKISDLKPMYWSKLQLDDDFNLYCSLGRIGTEYKNNMDPKENLSIEADAKIDDSVETINNLLFMESAIRLIIACDDAYRRLYYIQLSGYLPPLYVKNEDSLDSRQVRLFLPHLQEYYTVLLGSVDEIKHQAIHFIPQQSTKDIESLLNYCCDSNSITNSVTRIGNDNALANLFKCSWWETVELFYNTGWSRSDRVKENVLKSLKPPAPCITEGLEEHETPAPNLLNKWRESCRNYPCHLFAYATFSPDTLSKLASLLLQHSICRVVEMGAGTGYTARLLSRAIEAAGNGSNGQSVIIDAHDIYPTPEFNSSRRGWKWNEYHGYTPPYVKLKPFSGFHSDNIRGTALLLCYPPPLSSMAHDYLKSFLHKGGRFVVYVGEFKGLTGDCRFEMLLLDTMVCVERLPILTWGTDASHVTLWMVKREEANKTKGFHESKATFLTDHRGLLLPCSNCNVREARKRCRFDRSLAYCTEACYAKGIPILTTQLRLRMIEVDPYNDLRYINPFHFQDI